MAWEKNTPENVRRFDELAGVPGAERSVLFGCPCYRLGEERYALLWQNRVVLRLTPKDSAAVLGRGGERFSPRKGRVSKERVVLPEAIADSPRLLRTWVLKAARYAMATPR
jgi:hypothetical protein